MADSEIDFSCCFCGGARGQDDPMTLAASWREDDQSREQYWGAHRSCLIEDMHPALRDLGGPLFGE